MDEGKTTCGRKYVSKVTACWGSNVAVKCQNRISRRYTPGLDRELTKAQKKPALVFFMGTFKGYESAAALWADMKVDVRHGNDFSRVALVADQKWIEWGTKAADFVMTPEQKWFENTAGHEAIAWARANE